MNPEKSLDCSIAAMFGFIALLMLVMAGPEPVVIWFLVCLPIWWAAVMSIVSLWWDKQERKYRERERDMEWEIRDWKARAIRAEGAASIWKATAGATGGASRGGASSLSALAKACGSRQTLISLLHPDRHRNSRAANSATAYVMKHLPK